MSSSPSLTTSVASRYLSVASNRWFLAAAALVVAAHVTAVLLSIYVAPVTFDEAYVVQAPWNLVQGNGYSTFDWYRGENFRVFDNLISTGPAVLGPIAVSFLAFGVGILQVRWAMVPFYALLVVASWMLGRRIGGRWIGLVSAVAILALDLRLDLPHSVVFGVVDGIGEVPAAAFLVLAVLLLPRTRVGAGLAIGVAALCKLMVFLAVPAFLLALLFLLPAAGRGWQRWRSRVLAVLVFGIFGLLPSVLWELVKFASLGLDGYISALKAYGSFVISSGSGLDPTGPPDIVGRAVYLTEAWFLPWQGGLAVLLVLVALLLGWWFGRPRISDEPAREALLMTFVAGVGGLAIIVVWWIALSDSIFARHIFPALWLAPAVLLPFAASGLVRLRSAGRRWLRVASTAVGVLGLLVIVGQVGAHLVQLTGSSVWTRGQQEAVADILREEVPGGVQHIGYWSNPELRLLSQVDSVPYPYGSGPLVLSPQMRAIAGPLYDQARDLCVDVLYERDGYVVCEVDMDNTVPLSSGT